MTSNSCAVHEEKLYGTKVWASPLKESWEYDFVGGGIHYLSPARCN